MRSTCWPSQGGWRTNASPSTPSRPRCCCGSSPLVEPPCCRVGPAATSIRSATAAAPASPRARSTADWPPSRGSSGSSPYATPRLRTRCPGGVTRGSRRGANAAVCWRIWRSPGAGPACGSESLAGCLAASITARPLRCWAVSGRGETGPSPGSCCCRGCALLTHHGRRLAPETLRVELSRAGTEAGVGHVTPHQLRHTYATALVNAGVSLQSLMVLLGHVSAEMSLRYGRLFDATVRTEYERALVLAKERLGPVMPTATPVSLSTDWREAPAIKARLAGGFCVRAEAQGPCAYANICEHCPNLRTDVCWRPNESMPRPSLPMPRPEAGSRRPIAITVSSNASTSSWTRLVWDDQGATPACRGGLWRARGGRREGCLHRRGQTCRCRPGHPLSQSGAAGACRGASGPGGEGDHAVRAR